MKTLRKNRKGSVNRVGSGELVLLRWRRIGIDKRKSYCGRWTAYRWRANKWSLYDRNHFTDSASWSQICETARKRQEKEAQENNRSSATPEKTP